MKIWQDWSDLISVILTQHKLSTQLSKRKVVLLTSLVSSHIWSHLWRLTTFVNRKLPYFILNKCKIFLMFCNQFCIDIILNFSLPKITRQMLLDISQDMDHVICRWQTRALPPAYPQFCIEFINDSTHLSFINPT